jgi:hypothetical protein
MKLRNQFTSKTDLIRCLAFTAIVTCALTGVGHAQILNGDFSANASGYTNFPGYDGSGNPSAPTGWSASGAATAGVNGPDTGVGEVFTTGSFAINTGGTVRDYAFFQEINEAVPFLTQTFSVVAGQSYNINYDAAARGGANDSGFNAVISDNIGGNILFSQQSDLSQGEFFANASPGVGFTETVGGVNTFTADQTGLVTLSFNPIDPTVTDTNFTALLTNVSVVADTVAAAPEPSTYAMMFAGLGVLALVRRLRGKAV